MQGRRYAGRVKQFVRVDPDLYDAQVPSMLLQPIVENAYVHGISRSNVMGTLVVEGSRYGDRMKLIVMNTGIGLNPAPDGSPEGHGVGLRNIQKRLQLHFGENANFDMRQIDARHVQVSILLPLQFSNITNATDSQVWSQ
jgi:LytS/YehU family sensor histidine kinase